jgi:hypothetical protein
MVKLSQELAATDAKIAKEQEKENRLAAHMLSPTNGNVAQVDLRET